MNGDMSEGLAKEVVWLSGILTFGVAAEVLRRIGDLPVSRSRVWRTVKVHGEAIQKIMEKRAVAEQVAEPESQWMGCSADGGMIHIRDEGWKELKIGAIFEVESHKGKHSRTREEMDVGRSVRNSYVAHLGGPEPLGELMWREARRRGWEKAHATMMVGDGAPWIWNLASSHFYDSKQVVDWYHATEHLAKAAQILHGPQTEKAERWLKTQKNALYQGQALPIAHMLLDKAEQHPQQAELLQGEAGYFTNNHRRMQYMQMREDGWPIGSGMVESGCKQFKQRFSGPGMRWSRPGAERLIPIRSAIMGGQFDEVWSQAHPAPQK
jgi:hypothetical protein